MPLEKWQTRASGAVCWVIAGRYSSKLIVNNIIARVKLSFCTYINFHLFQPVMTLYIWPAKLQWAGPHGLLYSLSYFLATY